MAATQNVKKLKWQTPTDNNHENWKRQHSNKHTPEYKLEQEKLWAKTTHHNHILIPLDNSYNMKTCK